MKFPKFPSITCPACGSQRIPRWRIALFSKHKCPDCQEAIKVDLNWLGFGLYMLFIVGAAAVAPFNPPLAIGLLGLGLVAVFCGQLFEIQYAHALAKPSRESSLWRAYALGIVTLLIPAFIFATWIWLEYYRQSDRQIGALQSRLARSHINEREDSLALEMGSIYLNSEISPENTKFIPMYLLRMDRIRPDAEIDLFLNSVGGTIKDARAIIDAMRSVRPRINTIGTGEVASAALAILINGTGKRMAFRNTLFMFHNDQFIEKDGTVQDTGNWRVYKNILSRAKLPEAWMRTRIERADFYAEDALRWGVIDSILDPSERE